MSITPFLQHEAFDPEAIEAMGQAYENACEALGLANRDDQLNKLVAEQIINLAQTGLRNPTAMCLLAVKEFQAQPAILRTPPDCQSQGSVVV